MACTDLLIIAFMVCYGVELSGFVDSLKRRLWALFMKSAYPDAGLPLKPFDCTLCMSWWTGLAYLLFTARLTLWSVGWLAFLSFMTPVITRALFALRNLLLRLISGTNR